MLVIIITWWMCLCSLRMHESWELIFPPVKVLKFYDPSRLCRLSIRGCWLRILHWNPHLFLLTLMLSGCGTGISLKSGRVAIHFIASSHQCCFYRHFLGEEGQRLKPQQIDPVMLSSIALWKQQCKVNFFNLLVGMNWIGLKKTHVTQK